MANPEHLALLQQGVEAWNEWRHANQDIYVDLIGANLEGANLEGANFREANLSEANLSKANLSKAYLVMVNLSEANLSKASLSEANLVLANLRGANLEGANLRGAILGGANFREANLEGANLFGATLKFDLRIAAYQIVIERGIPSFPKPPSVLLGVSAPSKVKPGEEFTVRFVAYLQEFESQVDRILRGLSPRSKSHLGMWWCRWQEGVKVTVILSCQYLGIAEPQQEIEWYSPYQVIPFDVVVQKTAPETTVVLKLDVYILDIRVAALRLDLNIRKIRRGGTRVSSKPRKYKRTKATPATTAFASYASQDRPRVLDRVEALRISAGMDIFQDCLSLHPGEPWKVRLLQEILDRDLFLLFWSKFAKDSQWVKWEWTTALERRGEEVIQLHPLDIVEEAPPPPELAHLHFGSPVMRIRKSYEAITKSNL